MSASNLALSRLTLSLNQNHPLFGAVTPRVESVPIVAVCHLGWDWVWQRPQQFLSRMAKTHPLLFIETHCADVSESHFTLRRQDGPASIHIVQMYFPARRWHDGDFIDTERRRLLLSLLASPFGRNYEKPILWINDPMAVTAYAGHLGESMIVYDCMDELTQFANPPRGLIERERKLVAAADVIFCGGQKMRRKRLPANPNTHFYGTGVDCEHFGTAMAESTPIHPEIAALSGRVLGYFGVIDERLDYELLARLADADPTWNIAMVGPVAKVDPLSLPQRPNLHWLGAKPYSELPALTKGMDVCLMPFALNAATEYINPTKALEYMAAGKPVVSTALDEVRFNFAVAAQIAENHDEFILHCQTASNSPSLTEICQGMLLAADNTWEKIVSKMNGHMADVMDLKRTPVHGKNPLQRAPTSTKAAYV